MPDESNVDASASEGASADSKESGVAAQSAQKASGEAIDWKAKAKELESQLAKATGKAGATQATLTEQLTMQTNRAQSAEAKVADLSKTIQQLSVLDEVLQKTPEKTRAAVRLAAKGILPEVDLSDPMKAADAVIEKITAAAPELFAVKTEIKHMPHHNGDRSQKVGLAFSASGKRLV